MRRKRIRQRRAGAHLLVNVVEHRLEHRIVQARSKNIERLHERHAGFEQRRQFLVEDKEFVAGYLAALAADGEAGKAEPRLECKDVQALVLELAPEGGFALGDVDALDNLTRRRPEPATEFHLKD